VYIFGVDSASRVIRITVVAGKRTPEALERADVRRCGTLWIKALEERAVLWPEIASARIRLVEKRDEAALHEAMIAAEAERPELAKARVRGGRLGFVAESTERAGILLSYGWVAQPGDTVNDLDFTLQMPPGEAWIYDCATIPVARGRGLYVAILRAMQSELARRGFAHAWVGTAPANWPSQRGIAHAGFQKFADIDWTGATSVIYGAPGIPEALLGIAAMASDDGAARILPDAGIPWIDAIVERPANTNDGNGLRRFRLCYGEQLHWTERVHDTDPDAPVVTLRVNGEERTISGEAPFQTYAEALGELALGLPWLDSGDMLER
jgi:ribosomal protein S18 acetylase RimI-like enzyme